MDTKQQAFNWMILRSADGRMISGKSTPGGALVAGTTGDMFDLIQCDDGRVALFSLAAQGWVSIAENWLGAWAQEIGETESFAIVELEDGEIAFRSNESKRFLSAPAGDGAVLDCDAIEIGLAERFRLEKFDISQLPQGGHGCCNAWARPEEEEHPRVMWDDHTHKSTVEWAVIGMHRPDIQNDETRRLITFWSRREFQEAAYRGLEDADYEHPWRGSVIYQDRENRRNSIFTWHDHFYNPGTGVNYMGRSTNAVTEGRRHFYLSVHTAMRMLKLGGFHAPPALHDQAGYDLGISLHFLTDLTQPMHAMNFTNVFGEDGNYPLYFNFNDKRHSKFEEFAETCSKAGYFADYDKRFPMSHADVATDDVADATWFLHHTGVNQSRVFENRLRDLTNEMGRTSRDWTPEEALPAMNDSLLHAPKVVARYLAYWAKCVNNTWDDIDPGHYYRIETLRGDGWVCLHNGHYKIDTMDNGQDRMFLLFNPDGTWSIGCRSYKNNLWLGYDGLGGHWIGENRGRPSSPPDTSRFRFVRNQAPGGHHGFWIYESQLGHVVTVNEEGFPSQRSYLIRWMNTLPERQLFRLRKMEPIPENERREIRELWPDFGLVPWYGRA